MDSMSDLSSNLSTVDTSVSNFVNNSTKKYYRKTAHRYVFKNIMVIKIKCVYIITSIIVGIINIIIILS